MSDGKKVKVVVPDELLEQFPPEEREDMKAKLVAQFENMDPDDPPGERVEQLPAGTTTCPKCGKPLSLAVAYCQIQGQEPVDLFDCWPCDKGYAVPTTIQGTA